MAVETLPETTRDSGRCNRIRSGLCLICNNGAACTYPRNPDRPVWQCEEFETSEPLVRPVIRRPAYETGTASQPEEATQVELAGLCRTCANRVSCRFPHPIGGVWHCEEFQ